MTREKPGMRDSDHLRLEGEVVGLWFQMQARLEAHFTDLAAQYKLTAVQAKVLLLLLPDSPMTMRAIAGALQYDASNLTGVVDRLEEMGAVRRQPHPSDRRAKGVMLTAEGQRVRRVFWDRLTGNSGPLGRLNDRDLASLRRLLGSALRSPVPE
jgi:MarR family transcriptional regulator, organic hydroperoxide resistance regulator